MCVGIPRPGWMTKAALCWSLSASSADGYDVQTVLGFLPGIGSRWVVVPCRRADHRLNLAGVYDERFELCEEVLFRDMGRMSPIGSVSQKNIAVARSNSPAEVFFLDC